MTRRSAAPGDGSVVTAIVRTSRVLNEQMRRTRSAALQPLTPVHFMTVFYLYDHDGVTISDLGRHLNVTKQAAWDVVSVLEEQGLLERVRHPDDGRARALVLTDKGETTIEEGKARWAKLERELVAAVGRERALVVRDALNAYLAVQDERDDPLTRGQGANRLAT